MTGESALSAVLAVYLLGVVIWWLAVGFTVLAWSVYERGIVLGGVIGLGLGAVIGWIMGLLWPISAPLTWFNRRKVAYYAAQVMKNNKARIDTYYADRW